MPSSKLSGTYFETWVCQQLAKQQYRILDRNYRTPYGEIDIIAIHNHTLVLVEVKSRSSQKFGAPYEAVNAAKLTKIANSGHHFRTHHQHLKLPLATRIDVASILVNAANGTIDFQLIQNASL